MKYKLRSSVSVVDVGNNMIELFKTNIRKAIRIRVSDDTIKNILISLDGEKDIDEIIKKKDLDVEKEALDTLINYLKEKSVLSNVDLVKKRKDYVKYRRVIHFLEDYAKSDEMLLEMWKNIITSYVVIIGCGAVGSWVAINLVQSGVKNIILIDNDVVDISNLHRQFSYTESDIGKLKTQVLKKRILEFESNANVIVYNQLLDENMLYKVKEQMDLIINCADKPTVDITSKWIGKFAIKKNIPHMIGGGYNLHISLVGQTVIPYKSACVKCFEKQLEKQNKIESSNIKKLNIKNRKIGSFGPMCSIVASMITMEAIKILSKHIKPDNINRRGEFDIYSMSLKYNDYQRLSDCKLCGGKYDEE